MPLTLSDGRRIFLHNEMTDMDFDRAPGLNWLWNNFASMAQHPAFGHENDVIKHDVANFFNERMRGPYYIVESGSQGHGGWRQTTLCPIIIHPEDRKDFADHFVGKDWEEKPGAVEKNAVILVEQSARGYVYENRAMALLLEEIRNSSLPVVPNGNDINEIAVRLWPKPVQPLVATSAAGLISPPSLG